MKSVAIEVIICILASVFLMVIHELSKAIVYIIIRKSQGVKVKTNKSIWAVWKYIDPLGIVLGVIACAPFSKPHMFRIQDKKTNRILGFTGFIVLLGIFAESIYAMRTGYSQMFWPYLAAMSAGMFIVNLFPISTFDMGLVIAGFSSQKYLEIIKSDSLIKLVFLLALLFNLIQYISMRIMGVFL